MESNTLVYQVTATDRDRGDNGKVEFDLVSSEEFYINRETGEIFTLGSLDREGKSSYEVSTTLS